MKWLMILALLSTNSMAEDQTKAPEAIADSGSTVEEFVSLEELLKIRDPFKRVIKLSDPSINLADLPEIERTPVEDFKLIGVITGPNRLKALLRAPSGSTLFVSLNQKIGTRKGRVSRITSNFVEVKERVRNLLGREDIVVATIPLEGDTKN